MERPHLDEIASQLKSLKSSNTGNTEQKIPAFREFRHFEIYANSTVPAVDIMERKRGLVTSFPRTWKSQNEPRWRTDNSSEQVFAGFLGE